MDQLTAMGHNGTLLLLKRGYKTLSWKDTDFHLDIMVAWLVNDLALCLLKCIDKQQPHDSLYYCSREGSTCGVEFLQSLPKRMRQRTKTRSAMLDRNSYTSSANLTHHITFKKAKRA